MGSWPWATVLGLLLGDLGAVNEGLQWAVGVGDSLFLSSGGLKDWVCRSQIPAKSQPTKATSHKCLAFENVWCLQHLDGGAVPCSERPLSPGQPLSLSSRSSLTSGRALLEARARVCLSTGTGSSSGSSAGHRARHPRPTALAASLLARPSRSLG